MNYNDKIRMTIEKNFCKINIIVLMEMFVKGIHLFQYYIMRYRVHNVSNNLK